MLVKGFSLNKIWIDQLCFLILPKGLDSSSNDEGVSGQSDCGPYGYIPAVPWLML